MAGIRELIKTAEGIQELAYILSIPIESVKKRAQEMLSENTGNQSAEIIEEI